MALLADGRARSDGRAEPSLQCLCAREDPLRDRSLREGDQPPLRRAQQAPRRSPIPCRRVLDRRQGQKLEDFPYLKRWFEAIKARPATERAYARAKEINPNPTSIRTEEERKVLFGQT